MLISVHFRMKSGLLSVKCVDNCGTFIGKKLVVFRVLWKKECPYLAILCDKKCRKFMESSNLM